MVKRKLTYMSIVLSITIVFILGIIVGWTMSTSKFTETSKLIKENELNTESFLIEQELFETLGSQGCNLTNTRLIYLSQQLYQLGQVLGTDTAKKDVGESDYNILKRRFHLLQLKTYTITYRFKESCGLDVPIFLFYYSQNPESKEQGHILDEIVSAYGARVFAIEYEYAPELRFAEDYYAITMAPTVIMNYEQTFEGFTTKEIFEEAIINQEKP